MAAGRRYGSRTAPHFSRPGRTKVYRGSRSRVQRLKWRDHTPLEFWILVALVALMLLLGIPWLIEHPIHDTHQ
jgi:hypothetical protein